MRVTRLSQKLPKLAKLSFDVRQVSCKSVVSRVRGSAARVCFQLGLEFIQQKLNRAFAHAISARRAFGFVFSASRSWWSSGRSLPVSSLLDEGEVKGRLGHVRARKTTCA